MNNINKNLIFVSPKRTNKFTAKAKNKSKIKKADFIKFIEKIRIND
jgi:hypothetical protein